MKRPYFEHAILLNGKGYERDNRLFRRLITSLWRLTLNNAIQGEHEIHGFNPPMNYVEEKVVWQYKDMAIDLRKDSIPDEKLLNELGIDGWELACMFTYEKTLHAYFKRLVQHE